MKKPFNKPYLFDNSLEIDTYTALSDYIVSISPAPICDLVPSVDRIQLVFHKDRDSFDYLELSLSSSFDFIGTSKDKRRLIWNYFFEDSLIQLMSGTRYRNWLILYDPSALLQTSIRSIITPLMGLNVDSYTFINLQQVEFAYDFYPYDAADIFDIASAIKKKLYFRHSRLGSYKCYKGTHYQGLRGNIRHGSAGLRVYPKEESGENFMRLEIQLNSRGLKRKKIHLESLPILPNSIDPMKFLSFREPLDRESFDKLVNAGYKIRYPKELYKFSPSMENRTKSLFMRRILGSLFKEEIPSWGFAKTSILNETTMTVAQQIDQFKRIRKKLGLSYDHTKTFPAIKLHPSFSQGQLSMFEDMDQLMFDF